jgi:hypothetical protein
MATLADILQANLAGRTYDDIVTASRDAETAGIIPRGMSKVRLGQLVTGNPPPERMSADTVKMLAYLFKIPEGQIWLATAESMGIRLPAAYQQSAFIAGLPPHTERLTPERCSLLYAMIREWTAAADPEPSRTAPAKRATKTAAAKKVPAQAPTRNPAAVNQASPDIGCSADHCPYRENQHQLAPTLQLTGSGEPINQ